MTADELIAQVHPIAHAASESPDVAVRKVALVLFAVLGVLEEPHGVIDDVNLEMLTAIAGTSCAIRSIRSESGQASHSENERSG